MKLYKIKKVLVNEIPTDEEAYMMYKTSKTLKPNDTVIVGNETYCVLFKILKGVKYD